MWIFTLDYDNVSRFLLHLITPWANCSGQSLTVGLSGRAMKFMEQKLAATLGLPAFVCRGQENKVIYTIIYTVIYTVHTHGRLPLKFSSGACSPSIFYEMDYYGK